MLHIWHNADGVLYDPLGIVLCDICPCIDESSSSSSGSSSGESSSSSSSDVWPPYECPGSPCTDRSWTDPCVSPTPPSTCITSYNYVAGNRHRSISGGDTYFGGVLAYQSSQVIAGAAHIGFLGNTVLGARLEFTIYDATGTAVGQVQVQPNSTGYAAALIEPPSTFYTHSFATTKASGDVFEVEVNITPINATDAEYEFTYRVLRGGSPLVEYTWAEILTGEYPCRATVELYSGGGTCDWDDVYMNA